MIAIEEITREIPKEQEHDKKKVVSQYVSLLYRKVNKGRRPSKLDSIAFKPKNQIKRINKFLMTFPTLISIIRNKDWDKLEVLKFASNINPKRQTLVNYGSLMITDSSVIFADLLDFLMMPEMESYTYNALLCHKGFPTCSKSIQRTKSILLPVQTQLMEESYDKLLSKK